MMNLTLGKAAVQTLSCASQSHIFEEDAVKTIAWPNAACDSVTPRRRKRPPESRLWLEDPAIDDEAGILGDLVVEPPRRLVGVVRQPVDTWATRRLRPIADRLDQRPADALAAAASAVKRSWR